MKKNKRKRIQRAKKQSQVKHKKKNTQQKKSFNKKIDYELLDDLFLNMYIYGIYQDMIMTAGEKTNADLDDIIKCTIEMSNNDELIKYDDDRKKRLEVTALYLREHKDELFDQSFDSLKEKMDDEVLFDEKDILDAIKPIVMEKLETIFAKNDDIHVYLSSAIMRNLNMIHYLSHEIDKNMKRIKNVLGKAI